MKNTTKHQINETHLGTDATADDARRMAEILTEMGYESEYCAEQGCHTHIADPETGEHVEIDEGRWAEAAARALGETYIRARIEEYVREHPDARAEMAAGEWDEVVTDALYAASGAATVDEMEEARGIASEIAAEMTRPNYRIYDQTGSGVTEDIYAESLAAAVDAGREWMEGGDWERGTHEVHLDAVVRRIVRDEDGEIDDDATRDSDESDECGITLDAADPPACTGRGLDNEADEHGHVWRDDYDVVGGCKESPGVWGSGHGQVKIKNCCARCGMYQLTDLGATDPDNGQCVTAVYYTDADERSLAWVEEQLRPEALEIIRTAIEAAGYDRSSLDEDTLRIAIDTTDDDEFGSGPSDDTMEAIRSHLPDWITCDWANDGDTTADGETTHDAKFEIDIAS